LKDLYTSSESLALKDIVENDSPLTYKVKSIDSLAANPYFTGVPSVLVNAG
jgi:hypothetical protein